jgi:hypothetical protein
MIVSVLLARSRYRRVWSDPARKLRTLESFAATEEDGGRDLEVAVRRASDPELRAHLARHAADELRHAALFRGHAAELRGAFALAARDALEPDRAYDLGHSRSHGLDAHGFLRAALCEEQGEVAYVAMLHVAERRAAELFRIHHDLNRGDPALAATFEAILKDEKYHVAYTERLLERWRAHGRGREVDAGLRLARGSRFLDAWRRLGLRSAAGTSHAVLWAVYWFLLWPFGLASRLGRRRPVVKEFAGPSASAERITSQY